jgi:hypothetical protein
MVPLVRQAPRYVPFRRHAQRRSDSASFAARKPHCLRSLRCKPIPGDLDATSLLHTPLKERYRIPWLTLSDLQRRILQAHLPLLPQRLPAGPGTFFRECMRQGSRIQGSRDGFTPSPGRKSPGRRPGGIERWRRSESDRTYSGLWHTFSVWRPCFPIVVKLCSLQDSDPLLDSHPSQSPSIRQDCAAPCSPWCGLISP